MSTSLWLPVDEAPKSTTPKGWTPVDEPSRATASASALPGASPRLLSSSAAASAAPTSFETQRNPATQPGFLSTIGTMLHSALGGGPTTNVNATIPPLSQAPIQSAINQYSAERQRGQSVPYSAAAAASTVVGANPTGMEQAADVGNSRGVLAQAAVPAALAAAPLAVEGLKLGPGSALRELAQEHPVVAAARAMADPKFDVVKGMQDIAAARPYLVGAKSLADLQSRIPPAKIDVWQPYSDAVNQVGSTIVHGPDGPLTVAAYEAERLKNSANLDAARSMRPGDLVTAIQKDKSVADMSARDNAIKSAIDPELQRTGIDPQLIRRTYGALSGVQDSIEGRSTILEPPRDYGLGKMADLDVAKPLKSMANVPSGLRDIAAGRPLWSGSPTDIAVREGFRDTGEPKPNLRPFPSTISQGPQVRGLLGPGPIPAPPTAATSSATGVPAAAVPGTRATRLGLLLPEAPPAAPAYHGNAIPAPLSSVPPGWRSGEPVPPTYGENRQLPRAGEGSPGRTTPTPTYPELQRTQPLATTPPPSMGPVVSTHRDLATLGIYPSKTLSASESRSVDTILRGPFSAAEKAARIRTYLKLPEGD